VGPTENEIMDEVAINLSPVEVRDWFKSADAALRNMVVSCYYRHGIDSTVREVKQLYDVGIALSDYP